MRRLICWCLFSFGAMNRGSLSPISMASFIYDDILFALRLYIVTLIPECSIMKTAPPDPYSFTITFFSPFQDLNLGEYFLSEPVRIVEKKPIPSEAFILQGLPDVGLVGLIATAHIISQLNLTEIAHVDSDLLPPIVVLHEGLPHAPLRIFGDSELIATVAETAIPAAAIQPLMRALVDWGQSKKMRMMISIGGIPVPNRQDITDPRVFGAASTPSLLNTLSAKGVEILKEGYMVGPYALIMRHCAERKLPAIALLAQSFYNYPDPEAAAVAIKGFTKITKLKVDVSKLLEKGEEIRLRARDVMKRTQRELTKMKKSQEYDLPLYV